MFNKEHWIYRLCIIFSISVSIFAFITYSLLFKHSEEDIINEIAYIWEILNEFDTLLEFLELSSDYWTQKVRFVRISHSIELLGFGLAPYKHPRSWAYLFRILHASTWNSVKGKIDSQELGVVDTCRIFCCWESSWCAILNGQAELPQSGCKVRMNPCIKGFTTLRVRRGLYFFCPLSNMFVAAITAQVIQVIAFSSNLIKIEILKLV